MEIGGDLMNTPYVKYEARITCGWKHIAVDQAQGHPVVFLLDQESESSPVQILINSDEKFNELWKALKKLGR